MLLLFEDQNLCLLKSGGQRLYFKGQMSHSQIKGNFDSSLGKTRKRKEISKHYAIKKNYKQNKHMGIILEKL